MKPLAQSESNPNTIECQKDEILWHQLETPMRKQLVACAQKRVETARQEAQEAVEKVSRSWAKLIARIYEEKPLTCTDCGKKIKITAFIHIVPDTHDGFPEPEQQVHCDIGPDPPHCEDISDSPHWED